MGFKESVIKVLLVLLSAIIVIGCTTTKKANPLIQEYLSTKISHPETYRPVKTTVVAKGLMDVSGLDDWKHIPMSGVIEVVILHHEFTHDDRSSKLTENAFYFYMNPALDEIYYAHWDHNDGGPRFPIKH